MDPAFLEFMKYAGGAGSLGIVFGILYLIGTRMTRNLDKVADKIEALNTRFEDRFNAASLAAVGRHTEVVKALGEHASEMREAMAGLRGVLDGRSLTPIEGVPIVNESGRPITNPGVYGLGGKKRG